MKVRASHVYACLLLLAGVAWVWHYAGSMGGRSDGTKPVVSIAPTAFNSSTPMKTTTQTLGKALYDRWRLKATIDPSLGEHAVEVPASSRTPRKALLSLGQALQLPVALPQDDSHADDEVRIGPGGIILGKSNIELENAMKGLAAAAPEDRADFIHVIGGLQDQRVESVLLWALASSKDASVRGAAAFELAAATSADAHKALVDALSDENEMVIDQVRTAIEQIGGIKMEPLLRTVMQSSNDAAALEAGNLLERAFGLEVPAEFWSRFTRE